MVTANVKIIASLKSNLDFISQSVAIRQQFTVDPTDFSRDRKLPFKTIVGMLVNLPKRSLSVELQSFFENFGQLGTGCTKAAFSLQRIKLQPFFFSFLNKLMVQDFYEFYGKNVKRWEGFRLLAVDGSNVGVVNVPKVLAHFGSADNQFGGVPMARIMQIHDVLNDLTIWGNIFPRSNSENAIIANQIHHLPTDSLTLFDRGFPGFPLMYLLENHEVARHFVMRCKIGFSKDVKEFVASKKKDIITIIYPSIEAIVKLKEYGFCVTKVTGLKVRMVKIILPDGEVEVLLTNLYDKKTYSIKKMGRLYFMRWKIETTYSKQKNQMQMEIFTGHRVVCIQQDYAAGLLVSNLQSIIEKQCDDEVCEISANRKYDYKVNRNVCWASLKNRIVSLLIVNCDCLLILLELQYLFVQNIEPVRPGRSELRPKPKRKRGKYQTYTNYRRAI